MRQRWKDQPEKMRAVAMRASASVPKGENHPNAKRYLVKSPKNVIIEVKNISRWVDENQQILANTCKANSVVVGMLSQSGWKGWFAEKI